MQHHLLDMQPVHMQIDKSRLGSMLMTLTPLEVRLTPGALPSCADIWATCDRALCSACSCCRICSAATH